MKLRVFFKISRLAHAMQGRKQYEHEQCSADFPAETPWRVAYAALEKQHGAVTDSSMEGIAPAQYCTIVSHSVVDDQREAVVLEEERHQEQDLFGGTAMKDCLMDAPHLSKRKRRKTT